MQKRKKKKEGNNPYKRKEGSAGLCGALNRGKSEIGKIGR